MDREYRRDFYRAVNQRQADDERQREYYVPSYDEPALRAQDVVGTLRTVSSSPPRAPSLVWVWVWVWVSLDPGEAD